MAENGKANPILVSNQALQKPQEATENLPAGIYLVGDRKVSVK